MIFAEIELTFSTFVKYVLNFFVLSICASTFVRGSESGAFSLAPDKQRKK